MPQGEIRPSTINRKSDADQEMAEDESQIFAHLRSQNNSAASANNGFADFTKMVVKSSKPDV